MYFINSNAEGEVRAKASVVDVFNSERLTKEQSEKLVKENQEKLQLTEKQFARWAGKRYLVSIEVNQCGKRFSLLK
ncbi:MAG: hypothetical protein U5K84_02585 [Alkalibacterium sp.]|nr:hypothetical protein [Alkalibacterium sp.]